MAEDESHPVLEMPTLLNGRKIALGNKLFVVKVPYQHPEKMWFEDEQGNKSILKENPSSPCLFDLVLESNGQVTRNDKLMPIRAFVLGTIIDDATGVKLA